MAIYEQVDTGTTANDNTGDTIRASFTKINNNFTLQETLTINAQVGTTYVPVLADANIVMITMNNVAANTITIPANASVAFPIGTQLHITQIGAGQTTVAITTDALNTEAASTLVLTGQYAVATVLKIDATSWVLFGNLVAA